MGTKKKFTPEELKHLQANPYTLRVTADSISYTLAFKEAFWALSLQGYTGTAAFRKLGYNTEVLGFERIHNTTKRIRREARSPEGFHEGARGGVRIFDYCGAISALLETLFFGYSGAIFERSKVSFH